MAVAKRQWIGDDMAISLLQPGLAEVAQRLQFLRHFALAVHHQPAADQGRPAERGEMLGRGDVAETGLAGRRCAQWNHRFEIERLSAGIERQDGVVGLLQVLWGADLLQHLAPRTDRDGLTWIERQPSGAQTPGHHGLHSPLSPR